MWQAPDYLYLLVSESHRLTWNVSVRRHTGEHPNGQWKGPIASSISETWHFGILMRTYPPARYRRHSAPCRCLGTSRKSGRSVAGGAGSPPLRVHDRHHPHSSGPVQPRPDVTLVLGTKRSQSPGWGDSERGAAESRLAEVGSRGAGDYDCEKGRIVARWNRRRMFAPFRQPCYNYKPLPTAAKTNTVQLRCDALVSLVK